MGKLHQTLAVERDVMNTMTKILQEGHKTFSGRSGHFNETRKSYEPLDSNDTDQPDEEFQPMVSTVKEKLDYMEDHIVKAIDILIQKERANTVAKADIHVKKSDGTKQVLIANVPVTALVRLESVLTDIRNSVYSAIPTLDPAKVWKKDDTRQNVYVAEPVKKQRTKKVQEPLVMYPATDKHPAQTQLITIDKQVGTWTHDTASGAMSPRQKSEHLAKLDAIIAGVKIARAKANDIDIETVELGKKIFNYINEAL